MQVRVGEDRTLAVEVGDITTIPADAIANAANSALVGGGGVDGAIHRAGGPAIIADLERRYGRVRHCPPGSAVVTEAGRLPARWVLHAVGPIWGGGGAGEAETLRSAYATCMRLADELGAAHVTFPSISTGVYGYPADQAAIIAVETVAAALHEATSVRRVTLVAFSPSGAAPLFAALGRVGQPEG